jgi:hypothetical protein
LILALIAGASKAASLFLQVRVAKGLTFVIVFWVCAGSCCCRLSLV